MSWDIHLCKFERTYTRFEDLDDDTVPMQLGSRADVHAAISRTFRETDWSDPAWGRFESSFGSIEFNVGDDDPVDGLMLHVRADDTVVAPIVQMCLDQGWQAMDMSGGCFLEQSAVPEAGLRAWRDYRDRVIGPGSSPRDKLP